MEALRNLWNKIQLPLLIWLSAGVVEAATHDTQAAGVIAALGLLSLVV